VRLTGGAWPVKGEWRKKGETSACPESVVKKRRSEGEVSDNKKKRDLGVLDHWRYWAIARNLKEL